MTGLALKEDRKSCPLKMKLEIMLIIKPDNNHIITHLKRYLRFIPIKTKGNINIKRIVFGIFTVPKKVRKNNTNIES